MNRAKAIGQTFLITLVVVWIPWVLWFAVNTYILGHYDSKFGRDFEISFEAFVQGAAALVSSVVASAVHAVEMVRRNSLSWSNRLRVAVLAATILAVASPIVPTLRIPGLPTGIMEVTVPWALVSLACVTTVLIAGIRSGGVGLSPTSGRG